MELLIAWVKLHDYEVTRKLNWCWYLRVSFDYAAFLPI
jgi:hypothetical protein